MTASTPPLVDVIAGVLREHEEVYWNHDTRDVRCICEHYFGKIPGTFDARLRAHQARAVLDALTKAGGVEWGIRYGDGDIDEGFLHKSEAEADIARLRDKDHPFYDPDTNEPMTLLTRRRFDHTGPWTAVEG